MSTIFLGYMVESLGAEETSATGYATIIRPIMGVDLMETINNLASPFTYSEENKAAAENARTIYNILTKDEQEKVENYETLTAAEKVIEDTEVAAEVTSLVEELPEVDKITIQDRDEVRAARAAYDNLTKDQKDLIEKETLEKLEAAEKRIAAIERNIADTNAANRVSEILNKLPSYEETTLEDEETVQAAREAYDGLTDSQKNKVSSEALEKLVAAEKDSADYAAVQEKLEKGEKIASVYDVRLLQVVNGVETEIQPDEIEEGMVVTVRMAIPKGVSAKNLKVLHIHSYEDMEYIENFVVEGDEVVFDVDRFSEFAFVTPSGISAGAVIAIVLAVLVVAGVAVFFVLKKKGVIGAKSND